jgi:hypothetical protein
MESMRMELSTSEIRTGKVTFNVTNTSQNLVHEFIVAKSDKPIELLPYDEGENELKEDAIEVVNEIEDIDPREVRRAHGQSRAGPLRSVVQQCGPLQSGYVQSPHGGAVERSGRLATLVAGVEG